MAVIYSYGEGESITIGGTSSTGPFPKYSISRGVSSTGDGSSLGNTYSITINGIVLTSSSGDITDDGDMQSLLHLQMITKLQTNIALGHNVGRLEIVPYGGKPNTIEFLDARLVSVDLPEQSDESAGVLYTGYTFNFEATQDISNNLASLIPYWLKSAEENWQISIDEDQVAYDATPSGTPNRTYTITHSISAAANKKLTTDADFDRSGWKEAAEWVKTRVVSSPASAIITDVIGNDEFSNFSGTFFDTSAGTLSTNLSSFNFYNHTRVPNVGLFDGSYSITETWKASPVPAILDMNIEETQDEMENITMNLTGTITGLDSTSLNDVVIDKYTNANNVLTQIDSTAHTILDTYYAGPGTLENVVRSKNIGRNKGAGVITFSYSYNDVPVLIDNAISSSLRISDNNENHVTTIIAIIPIISKLDPIIQDMNASTEQRKSVQLDVVMKRAYRAEKPASARQLALTYAPVNGKLQTNSENWEPNTGVYSINVEWAY